MCIVTLYSNKAMYNRETRVRFGKMYEAEHSKIENCSSNFNSLAGDL